MYDFLSISDLLYEIKRKVPDDDRKSILDIDNFIKMSTADYINSILGKKVNYHTFNVQVLPISNFNVKIPKNCKRIVQVAGSDNKYLHGRRNNWRSEVVAQISKENDCYQVTQRVCKCQKERNCTCVVQLNINDLERGIS